MAVKNRLQVSWGWLLVLLALAPATARAQANDPYQNDTVSAINELLFSSRYTEAEKMAMADSVLALCTQPCTQAMVQLEKAYAVQEYMSLEHELAIAQFQKGIALLRQCNAPYAPKEVAMATLAMAKSYLFKNQVDSAVQLARQVTLLAQ